MSTFAEGWATQRLESTSLRNGLLNLHSLNALLGKIRIIRASTPWKWVQVDVTHPVVCDWKTRNLVDAGDSVGHW